MVREAPQRELCDELARLLEQRGLEVVSREPGPWQYGTDDVPVVVFGDRCGARAAARQWEFVERSARAGSPAVVVLPGDRRVPDTYRLFVRGTVRVERSDASVARIYQDLQLEIVGPLPAWLGCITAASRLHAPTGVTWWAGDPLVADEHHGHVVELRQGGGTTLLPGLDAPDALQLDREKLLVANRGGDEILLFNVHSGARAIRSITAAAGGRLRRPNGAHQGHGVTAIADTDNHRAIYTLDDPFEHGRPRWATLDVPGGLSFPAAVHTTHDAIWIADTFHHRLLAFDHEGRCLLELSEFAYPVAMAQWRGILLVADEGTCRIEGFEIARRDGVLTATPVPALLGLGRPWIGKPHGLALNIADQLLVSDRRRRCVWRIDLARALAGGSG